MIEWAWAGRPKLGEPVSGDCFVLEEHEAGAFFAVIDGLGHGAGAVLAAQLAAEVLRAGAREPLPQLLASCHLRLKKTRGAVLSAAAIDDQRASLNWTGMGNVQGTLLRSTGEREALLLREGIVGSSPPVYRLRVTTLARGDLVVLNTDGITSGWTGELSGPSGLQSLVDQIVRAHSRPDDDALVLAVRWLGPRR